MAFIKQNPEDVMSASASRTVWDIGYNFPHNLTKEQQAMVDLKKVADVIRNAGQIDAYFYSVDAHFTNGLPDSDNELAVVIQSSDDLSRENMKQIMDALEVHMQGILGQKTDIKQTNDQWKPRQFENVWFLVSDPTKIGGEIPACGNIRQINDDGTMEVKVISAETRLLKQIPYEGHAVITVDECAPKKDDIYDRIRQANADNLTLRLVYVDGYNLEVERYRYLRPNGTENSDFKIRQAYLAEDTSVYIRNYPKNDNREGFSANLAAGGNFYMIEEPYNGVALISTTKDGKDGYTLPIDMNYIRQEVRLDPEHHFGVLTTDLQMYIQDGGTLYMLGEPLDSDVEPIAYLSKESRGGNVCTTAYISDIEYVTVEDQRMEANQDQDFAAAVAGIPVEDNQLGQ